MLYQYLLKLYKYYCKVNGINYNLLTYRIHHKEFLKWLDEYKVITQEFKNYLIELGFYNYLPTAEINKGKYDSIAGDELVVYSPYAKTLGKEPTTFAIVGYTPIIYNKKQPIVPKERIYLTSNPNREDISHWLELAKRKDYDISLGVYGTVNDENYKDNLVLMAELKSILPEDYIMNNDVINGNYFCTLNNKHNTKVLRLETK